MFRKHVPLLVERVPEIENSVEISIENTLEEQYAALCAMPISSKSKTFAQQTYRQLKVKIFGSETVCCGSSLSLRLSDYQQPGFSEENRDWVKSYLRVIGAHCGGKYQTLFLDIMAWEEKLRSKEGGGLSSQKKRELANQRLLPLAETISTITQLNEEEKPRTGLYALFQTPKKAIQTLLEIASERNVKTEWSNIYRNYIQFQGSGTKHAISEIVSNAIDAIFRKHGEPTIGRYGMGAFQLMKALQDPKDAIVYTTVKKGQCSVLTLKKIKDEIFYSLQTRSTSQPNGTTVRVIKQKGQLNQDNVEVASYLKGKYAYQCRVPIWVGNESCQTNLTVFPDQASRYCEESVRITLFKDGYEVVDTGVGMDIDVIFNCLLRPRTSEGAMTKTVKSGSVFYSHDDIVVGFGPCIFTFVVNGVAIEAMHATGSNLPKEMAICLSNDTWLPDSRDTVMLNEDELKAVSQLVETIVLTPNMDALTKIRLMNGVALAIRTKLDTQGEDLDTFRSILKSNTAVTAFVQGLEDTGSCIKNTAPFVSAYGRNEHVHLLDDCFYVFSPEKIGFRRRMEWEANQWRLYIGNTGKRESFTDPLDRTVYLSQSMVSEYTENETPQFAVIKALIDPHIGYGACPDFGGDSKLISIDDALAQFRTARSKTKPSPPGNTQNVKANHLAKPNAEHSPAPEKDPEPWVDPTKKQEKDQRSDSTAEPKSNTLETTVFRKKNRKKESAAFFQRRFF